MLTLEENELLTRTGPGRTMGELMRRYWLPRCCSGSCQSRLPASASEALWRCVKDFVRISFLEKTISNLVLRVRRSRIQ